MTTFVLAKTNHLKNMFGNNKVRKLIDFCILLAIGVLTSCQFIKPLDGPGMEREVNDSSSSGTQDSVNVKSPATPSTNVSIP